MSATVTTMTAPAAAPLRSRPPLPPPPAAQQPPMTASQMYRQLSGQLVALTGRVTELSGRVDLGELQRQALVDELARMEVRLAAKADRRLTVLDRFAQQPVPEVTVDEWLAECDVGFWMDELYGGGDLEMLANVKPAVALTRVLEAFVATWPVGDAAAVLSAASPTAAAAKQQVAPPIRGMMVGRCRALYWFLAANWGAATGAPSPPPPAPAAQQQQQQVIDGNASILLCGASVVPDAPPPGSVVMADADAMSEITDDAHATPRYGAAASVVAATPRAPPPVTPRAMSVVAQQHLVPLEGVWHRMDIKRHWANIVTVLFQRYGEYMDRVSVRATKDQQLALLAGRAKCCNATERSKMRVAFYDAIAKIPGAILV